MFKTNRPIKYLPQQLRPTSLTYKFCLINISFAYDGITIYKPKGYDYEHEHASFAHACSALQEVDTIEAQNGLHKDWNERFDDFHILVIKTPAIPFERAVRGDDADHGLYHCDQLNARNNHYHIKFRKQITRDQFILILNLLKDHKLILEEEKESCLNKYQERYQTARDALKVAANHGEIDLDLKVKAILGYIYQCNDNDILADLHEYLLNSEYDYLRNCATSSTTKIWQGTNKQGEVVPTSESWAKIEKGFALQMAVNVCNNVQLTDAVGQDRAQQLSSTYRFFSIKRKAHAGAATNNIYQSLLAADNRKLDKSYHKHFNPPY